MRRTPTRRLLAAALLVASVLAAPVMATSATATAATAAGTPTGVVHPLGIDPHDGHDHAPCSSNGLGHGVTARLDKAIADVRKQAAIPGVAVGLWMPGKGCYVRATGVADKVTRQPMSTDFYSRIGSETKTFTVTALLQLVDERRIGLDDPISRYVHGVPNGRHITLRHLAEMRSGLFPYSADADFAHDLLSDPTRSFTPRELLAYGFKHRNTAAPGKVFVYNNSNLVLLGLVIEKVTGHHVADVINRRVLRPAHLDQTLFPDGPNVREFPEPHAHGYTNQTLTGAVADSTDWNPSWAWSAGAMISTMHDLRSWAKTVATGELLSPETQKQRLKTLPTGFPGLTYGLGIFETGGWIGHNGSIPGYESVTVYLPALKATLVVLINTDITTGGQEPSTLLARAVTKIATPGHVYDGSAPTR
ncbi:serine hydrolase domain-containing protein [Streptomyces prunicolor]|uniref:Serine hydrolase domain-containing protein n=1 Tax=Streptomyces prunicolor TaxID=67348 RepID=A0ABU4FBE6_9ACTN|nr:serine hydrolase domain-containing protein [Streptomyces prunicolor]MDV7217311.1 serine hydrolase domain-containing protein [Streptomyces prunicolor]